jgi:hypothetical protein
MNGVGLTASFVSSLAWPAATVIILAIFRKPVTKLIGRATQYKGFGQEITFGDELADVESKVQDFTDMRVEYLWLDNQTRYWNQAEKRRVERRRATELTQGSAEEIEPKEAEERGMLAAPDYRKLNRLVEIAQDHPSQAVLGAWDWLRAIVTNRLPGKDPLYKTQPPLSWIVPAQIAEVVKELNTLRDKVAHGQHTPTPGEAITYIKTCEQMGRIIHRTYPRRFRADKARNEPEVTN